MKERITVMIENDIVKKLRKYQAEKITRESRNVSLAEVINELLEDGLKK